MKTNFLVLSGLAAIVGFAVYTANQGLDSKWAAQAEANGLNNAEAQAFKTCSRELMGTSLKLSSDQGTYETNRVPAEICLCQARTMVRVFRDGQYGGHRQVLSSIVKKRPVPELDSADFRDPRRSSAEVVAELTRSIFNCTANYQNERSEGIRRFRERSGRTNG